jgi:hypothetical protein
MSGKRKVQTGEAGGEVYSQYDEMLWERTDELKYGTVCKISVEDYKDTDGKATNAVRFERAFYANNGLIVGRSAKNFMIIYGNIEEGIFIPNPYRDGPYYSQELMDFKDLNFNWGGGYIYQSIKTGEFTVTPNFFEKLRRPEIKKHRVDTLKQQQLPDPAFTQDLQNERQSRVTFEESKQLPHENEPMMTRGDTAHMEEVNAARGCGLSDTRNCEGLNPLNYPFNKEVNYAIKEYYEQKKHPGEGGASSKKKTIKKKYKKFSKTYRKRKNIQRKVKSKTYK